MIRYTTSVDCINPPIRGSIGEQKRNEKLAKKLSINPPIRGSIAIEQNPEEGAFYVELYQSPYKGFNRGY